MIKLTAEVARELLDYDPETGRLRWKYRRRKYFGSDGSCKAWNNIYAGKAAFTAADTGGYLHGRIFDRAYKAHRVIWLMQTGDWPKAQVDHINHDRSDNIWCNLREVTNAENNKNRSLSATNTSGRVGVYWHKRSRKWRAQIRVNGLQKSLGYFDMREDAIDARKSAEKLYGFHENHGAEA